MKLRPLSAHKLIKVLNRLGFQPLRQSGSHVLLINPDGKKTVVPVHPGEEIDVGLLRRILKEAGIERDYFLKVLEEI